MVNNMQNNAFETESKIQSFFRNKKVFVTGGTGFLGKGLFFSTIFFGICQTQ